MLKKVVFLDRDGVINKDSPDYIKSWSEFEFLPGSIDALKALTENGFTLIVITNQSIINRKMVSSAALAHIHAMLKQTARTHGSQIKDIFFCPHTPQQQCGCRKPKPGLIHQARQKYGIHLESAVMVGDSAKDIQCAFHAGCGSAVLVKTGNGRAAEKILAPTSCRPDYIAADLRSASEWIIAQQPFTPKNAGTLSYDRHL
jgi:D-glycero-D-manno-heptose 1,7-bisphosphate phosphatase